ncbi:YitT family protein [Phosphitispora sp. TUW77]|uniref:YitT family protein n=1 Tax=Phosphitispora sp. TUW77 TaxID=3152361 RepID=UPI003AB8BCF5
MKLRVFREYFFILIGVTITAVGLDMFLVPNKIAAGGVSGIATIVYYKARFPVGLTMFIINVPLFLAGVRKMGMGFGVRSLFGTATISLAVDLLAPVLPIPTRDPLLASIYGGIFAGIGIGIVFRNRGTTGGTDLAAAIINNYMKMSVGVVLFMIDASVIIAAGITFRSAELALYALLTVFLTSRVIDIVQEGFGYAKAALIISDNPEAVSEAILNRMDRGVTTLKGKGMYTGTNRDVVFSVVTRAEISILKELVHSIDEKAFVILTDVHEVLGEGFKRRV